MLRRYLLLALVAVGVMPNVYGMKKPVRNATVNVFNEQKQVALKKSLAILQEEVNSYYSGHIDGKFAITEGAIQQLPIQEYYKQLYRYDVIYSAYESVVALRNKLDERAMFKSQEYVQQRFNDLFTILNKSLANDQTGSQTLLTKAMFGLEHIIDNDGTLMPEQRASLKQLYRNAHSSLQSLLSGFDLSIFTMNDSKLSTIIKNVKKLVGKHNPRILAPGIDKLKIAKSPRNIKTSVEFLPPADTSTASSSTRVPAINPMKTPTPSTPATSTTGASSSTSDEDFDSINEFTGTLNIFGNLTNSTDLTPVLPNTDTTPSSTNIDSNSTPVTPVVEEPVVPTPATPIVVTPEEQLAQAQTKFAAKIAKCVEFAREQSSENGLVGHRVNKMIEVVDLLSAIDVEIKLAHRWLSSDYFDGAAKCKFSSIYEYTSLFLDQLLNNISNSQSTVIEFAQITPKLFSELNKALSTSPAKWIQDEINRMFDVNNSGSLADQIKDAVNAFYSEPENTDMQNVDLMKLNNHQQQLNVYKACATPGLSGANRNLIATVDREKAIQFPAPDKNSVPQSDLTKRLLVHQARIAQVLLQQEHALNQIKKNQPAEQAMYRDIEQKLEVVSIQALKSSPEAVNTLKKLVCDTVENNLELVQLGLFDDSTAEELENISSIDNRDATYENLKQQIEKTIKGIRNLEQTIIADAENNSTLWDKVSGFVAAHQKTLVAAAAVVGLGLIANYCDVMPSLPSLSSNSTNDIPGVCPVPETFKYQPHPASLLGQMFDQNAVCEVQPQTPVESELMLQSPAELECPVPSALALIPGEDVVTHNVTTITPIERSVKLASYEDVTQVPPATTVPENQSAVALVPGKDVVTHKVTTPMEQAVKLAGYEDVTKISSSLRPITLESAQTMCSQHPEDNASVIVQEESGLENVVTCLNGQLQSIRDSKQPANVLTASCLNKRTHLQCTTPTIYSQELPLNQPESVSHQKPLIPVPTEIKTSSEPVVNQQGQQPVVPIETTSVVPPVTYSFEHSVEIAKTCKQIGNGDVTSHDENHEIFRTYSCNNGFPTNVVMYPKTTGTLNSSFIPADEVQGFQATTPVLPGNTESAQTSSMTTMLNSLPSLNVLPTYEHLKTGLTVGGALGLLGSICSWGLANVIA